MKLVNLLRTAGVGTSYVAATCIAVVAVVAAWGFGKIWLGNYQEGPPHEPTAFQTWLAGEDVLLYRERVTWHFHCTAEVVRLPETTRPEPPKLSAESEITWTETPYVFGDDCLEILPRDLRHSLKSSLEISGSYVLDNRFDHVIVYDPKGRIAYRILTND